MAASGGLLGHSKNARREINGYAGIAQPPRSGVGQEPVKVRPHVQCGTASKKMAVAMHAALAVSYDGVVGGVEGLAERHEV